MTDTQSTPRHTVRHVPVAEVRAGDRVRYLSLRGRSSWRRLLSMDVERAVDCGVPETGGASVILLRGAAVRLDGTRIGTNRTRSFRADEKLDVIRDWSAEELGWTA